MCPPIQPGEGSVISFRRHQVSLTTLFRPNNSPGIPVLFSFKPSITKTVIRTLPAQTSLPGLLTSVTQW